MIDRDGFNWDGVAGNADDAPPTADQGERFVPFVIELGKVVDLAKAWLKVEYKDSSPANGGGGLTRTGAGTEASPFAYTPAAGDLRLWTKKGDAARDGHPFAPAAGGGPAGDYVAATNDAGRYYTSADLAKLNWVAAPGGGMEVTLWIEAIRPSGKAVQVEVDPDGAGAAGFMAADQVRLTNTQLAFVSDGAGNGAHVVDDNDPVAGFARIGNWGSDDGAGGLDGYTAAGAVRNNVGTAANGWDNFIDRDPDRFYIRVVDPTKNTDAGTRDTLTVKLGTLTGTGAGADNQTDLTLTETGNDTGVFISESQLLTAPDLSGVAAADQDDGFAVQSAVAGVVQTPFLVPRGSINFSPSDPAAGRPAAAASPFPTARPPGQCPPSEDDGFLPRRLPEGSPSTARVLAVLAFLAGWTSLVGGGYSTLRCNCPSTRPVTDASTCYHTICPAPCRHRLHRQWSRDRSRAVSEQPAAKSSTGVPSLRLSGTNSPSAERSKGFLVFVARAGRPSTADRATAAFRRSPPLPTSAQVRGRVQKSSTPRPPAPGGRDRRPASAPFTWRCGRVFRSPCGRRCRRRTPPATGGWHLATDWAATPGTRLNITSFGLRPIRSRGFG